MKDLIGLYEQALKLQEYIDSQESEDIDYDQLFKEFGLDMKEIEQEMMENKTKLPLNYTKLNSDVIDPFYNYESDSGFDLYSTEDITIKPFGRALIPTGLSFDIKDGYEIQVRSKSGLAINQGLFVLNSPGTVDSGYLGEVKVILFNTNSEPFTITKGMKVAQAVLCPVVGGKWVELINTESLPKKDRGDNGFGSTGII
jgi:dUTP pyrophosphatase